LSQLTKYPPALVCEPCWSIRAHDPHPDLDPIDHPKTVFILLGKDLYAHRMVGFGNDGIETVCGQHWTNAGLVATFTGA